MMIHDLMMKREFENFEKNIKNSRSSQSMMVMMMMLHACVFFFVLNSTNDFCFSINF